MSQSFECHKTLMLTPTPKTLALNLLEPKKKINKPKV